MHLTPDLKSAYDRDGFLFYNQRLLSDSEISAVTAEIDRICTGQANHWPFLIMLESGRFLADEPATPDNPVRKIQSLSYSSPFFARLAKDPRIVDVVESILGPDIKLYTDEYFMKNPARQGKPWNPYIWHQDAKEILFAPADQYVTCWIALDRATPENGCMQFIPGSHRYGVIPAPQRAQFLKHPAIAKPIDAPRDPGYAVFHHGLNFHHSESNRTDKPRRALAYHYISAKTLYLGAEDENLRHIVQQGNMSTDYRFMPIRGREFANCV